MQKLQIFLFDIQENWIGLTSVFEMNTAPKHTEECLTNICMQWVSFNKLSVFVFM